MDDLIEHRVEVGGRTLSILRPRDPEALLEDIELGPDEFLPYWAELWPSALALSAALSGRDLRGVRVLELGCGLGLPSLAAALAGADVLATDWSADAVALLAGNARRNGIQLRASRWSWTDPPEALGPRWPLVIASDVLYERRNGPWLERALDGLVAEGGEAWIADPGRSAAEKTLRDLAPLPGAPGIYVRKALRAPAGRRPRP